MSRSQRAPSEHDPGPNLALGPLLAPAPFGDASFFKPPLNFWATQPPSEEQCIIPHMLLCAQSGLTLCNPLWTVDRQAPLSMAFSRQEYWRGLPFPTPGYLPNPGIEPVSPASPAWAGRFLTTTSTTSVLREKIISSGRYGPMRWSLMKAVTMELKNREKGEVKWHLL